MIFPVFFIKHIRIFSNGLLYFKVKLFTEITRLTTSPRLFAMLKVSIVFTDEAKIETGHNINKTAKMYLAD